MKRLEIVKLDKQRLIISCTSCIMDQQVKNNKYIIIFPPETRWSNHEPVAV